MNQESQLKNLIEIYQCGCSIKEKLNAIAKIQKLADEGFAEACYVIGAAQINEGPCGDGVLAENREKALQYLNRSHELGDPIAKDLIESKRLR